MEITKLLELELVKLQRNDFALRVLNQKGLPKSKSDGVIKITKGDEKYDIGKWELFIPSEDSIENYKTLYIHNGFDSKDERDLAVEVFLKAISDELFECSEFIWVENDNTYFWSK